MHSMPFIDVIKMNKDLQKMDKNSESNIIGKNEDKERRNRR